MRDAAIARAEPVEKWVDQLGGVPLYAMLVGFSERSHQGPHQCVDL